MSGFSPSARKAPRQTASLGSGGGSPEGTRDRRPSERWAVQINDVCMYLNLSIFCDVAIKNVEFLRCGQILNDIFRIIPSLVLCL